MERPYKLTIDYDPDPQNPREWDNAATMWCAHNRYNLVGGVPLDTSSYDSWDEALASIDHVVVLPLYLYDHSGITMRTTPFSCRWDSGQVGWITMSKEQILNTYGGKRLTAKKKQQALALMRSEVETYDNYLNGEVFEYNIIDADGEIVESCGGYYDRESVVADGKQALARWSNA